MDAGVNFDGLQFRVSTFCTSGGCVEVARLADGRVAVRSSDDTATPPAVFSVVEWRAFVAGVKNGEFDY